MLLQVEVKTVQIQPQKGQQSDGSEDG